MLDRGLSHSLRDDPAQCKRNRKREMDRISQQRKRKRDRENMQKMEQRLELLQTADGQHPLLTELTKAASENEQRTIRHRKRLLQINGLIKADLADLGYCDSGVQTVQSDTHSSPQRDDAESLSHEGTINLDNVVLEASDEMAHVPCRDDLMPSQALSIDDCTGFTAEYDMLSLPWDHTGGAIESNQMQRLIALPQQSLHQQDGPRKLWNEVEQLLTRAKRPSATINSTETAELDMHIVINAVLGRGWSQFSQVVSLDTRWSCLKELDERYFSQGSGQVDRLAILTIASQLLGGDKMTWSFGSKLLPEFVRPRPSQEVVPHSAIADFYVWPGFRERLTMCPQYYIDTFLHVMHVMFRFVWPYTLKSTYNIDPATGLSGFSPKFLEHLGNLRCWTMDSDFLAQYPDFRGDVPVFNAGPSRLLSDTVSYPQWYNFDATEMQQFQNSRVSNELTAIVAS